MLRAYIKLEPASHFVNVWVGENGQPMASIRPYWGAICLGHASCLGGLSLVVPRRGSVAITSAPEPGFGQPGNS